MNENSRGRLGGSWSNDYVQNSCRLYTHNYEFNRGRRGSWSIRSIRNSHLLYTHDYEFNREGRGELVYSLRSEFPSVIYPKVRNLQRAKGTVGLFPSFRIPIGYTPITANSTERGRGELVYSLRSEIPSVIYPKVRNLQRVKGTVGLF
uniref:Uncharacterized protein n=1 Tax=Parascaris univalens TaxID=6257 RepID=A0A915AG95_PARUN